MCPSESVQLLQIPPQIKVISVNTKHNPARPSVTRRNSRRCHHLVYPVAYFRIDSLRLSFSSRTIFDWNSLPTETTTDKTLTSFQSRLPQTLKFFSSLFKYPFPPPQPCPRTYLIVAQLYWTFCNWIRPCSFEMGNLPYHLTWFWWCYTLLSVTRCTRAAH